MVSAAFRGSVADLRRAGVGPTPAGPLKAEAECRPRRRAAAPLDLMNGSTRQHGRPADRSADAAPGGTPRVPMVSGGASRKASTKRIIVDEVFLGGAASQQRWRKAFGMQRRAAATGRLGGLRVGRLARPEPVVPRPDDRALGPAPGAVPDGPAGRAVGRPTRVEGRPILPPPSRACRPVGAARSQPPSTMRNLPICWRRCPNRTRSGYWPASGLSAAPTWWKRCSRLSERADLSVPRGQLVGIIGQRGIRGAQGITEPLERGACCLTGRPRPWRGETVRWPLPSRDADHAIRRSHGVQRGWTRRPVSSGLPSH